MSLSDVHRPARARRPSAVVEGERPPASPERLRRSAKPEPYDSLEKRTELVRAATRLLHEQGFQRTTLANVASAANVPLGNVYYYFKTKDALAEAVIALHARALRDLLASWALAHPDPHTRLRCLVRAPLGPAESFLELGSDGSLIHELGKLGKDSPLAKAGTRLLALAIDWAAAQFSMLGFRPSDARARAMDLVSLLHGATLIAHTMRSQTLLRRQLRRVELSLDASISTSHTRTGG
jgi:TetR/AcrR family transcriptional repressor of nem operon